LGEYQLQIRVLSIQECSNLHALMNDLNYSGFSPEDFLADAYFQQWVLQPGRETDLFWQAFLRNNPHQQGTVAEAKALLQTLRFEEDRQQTTRQVEDVWHRIESTRQEANLSGGRSGSRNPVPMWRRPVFQQVAAVFTGLLVFAALLFYWQGFPRTEQHTAGYGEVKSVTLPDGSVAVLNGNSTLRYASRWNGGGAREVQLEGEAFFKVTHTQNHQKFMVRTTSPMAVEVLGTEFVVRSRPSGTRVVLSYGKVKLHLDQGPAGREVTMRPGEMVELNGSAEGYSQKMVNPEHFTSFRQRKLLLKDTPIREIVLLLQDTYGLEVQVPDPAVLDQRISGSIPADSVNSLLFVLSQAFGYTIEKEGNQVILKEKSSP
jgi:ferric-dicitrate binding protein FerR (iron transport regulator)